MADAAAVEPHVEEQAGLLRIFIIHASHNLTNHAASGDGLVAWGYIAELARRGHRIHAVTDSLDVVGEMPANLTLVELPRRSRNAIIHYLSYMRRVRSLYNQVAITEGVDVLHQMNPVVRGLSLAMLGSAAPVVLGTYVGDWEGREIKNPPYYRARSFWERAAASFKIALDALQQYHATELLLATRYALSRVPQSSKKMERIRYVHHGVDTVLFSAKVQNGDPSPRPFSIIFVGKIWYGKGVVTLIDAFRIVAASIPEARLVFVGPGIIDQMKRLLKKYGLCERAEFLGSCSRMEVAGWLRACTVLCAPSFGEPYGQNILEAMACSKPVVATSEGGHPHLFDLDGGYQVSPGDPKALATALLAVLSDPLTARAMGNHNRAVVESRNSWSQVTNDLERAYRGAIARRGGTDKSLAFRTKEPGSARFV